MSKIKIMHLLQSDRFSGAENVVCKIIELFHGCDYEMTYVCTKGPIEEVLKSKNINYFLLEKFSQKEIDLAVKLLKPDIIHAHDFNASVKAAKYSKNIKIISHIHNNPLWLSKLDIRSVVYGLCCYRYIKVIGVSNSVYDEFIFKRFIKNKFIILGNTVDKELIYKKCEEKTSKVCELLYVGRLFEPKNPIGFLEIVKKIVDETNSNIRALMVGEGPMKEECEEFIHNNNLKDNVEMIGFTDNPYKFMQNAKIVVMPSVFEGFGLVAVEALLLGIPVVCSPVGGLVKIIPSEYECFASSTKEFVDIINRLLADEVAYEKIAKNAPSKMELFCDMKSYERILNSIYDECKVRD